MAQESYFGQKGPAGSYFSEKLPAQSPLLPPIPGKPKAFKIRLPKNDFSVKKNILSQAVVQGQLDSEVAPAQDGKPTQTKKWELGDWADQTAKDLAAPFVGLPGLLKVVAEGAMELPASIKILGKELFKNPDLLGQVTSSTLKKTWDLATEHYRNEDGDVTWGSFGDAFRFRSGAVAYDLLTVLSLGGLGVAKTAQVTEKIARSYRITKGLTKVGSQLGGMEIKAARLSKSAQKMAKLADDIQNLPFKAAFGIVKTAGKYTGATKVFDAVNEAMGNHPVNKLAASDELNELSKHVDGITNTFKTYIPKLKRDKALRVMDRVDVLDPADWTPAEMEFFDEFSRTSGLLQEHTEKMKATMAGGVFTQEGLGEAASIKKVGVRLKEDALRAQGMAPEEMAVRLAEDLTPNELELAKYHHDATLQMSELLGSGKIQSRAYAHWMDDAHLNVADALHAALNPGSTKAFVTERQFKRLTGKSLKAKDPVILAVRGMAARARLLGAVKYINRVISETATDVLKPGYEPIPAELLSKIVNRQVEVNDILLNRFASNVDSVKALYDTGEIMFGKIAEISQDLVNPKIMYVPKAVARGLRMYMARSTGLMKFYEKGLDLFRDLALSWSPRFYVNNLLGNGILQTLNGVFPGYSLRHEYQNIPAEMARVGMQAEERGIFAPFGGSRLFKWLRSKQAAGSFYTDTVPRINVGVVETERTLLRAKALGKLTEPFSTMIDGGEINKVIQHVFDARQEWLNLSDDLMSNKILPFREGGNYTPREIVQASMNSSRIQQRLAELAPLRGLAEEAINNMERLLGPYGRSSPFERAYVRNLFPFWTFTKTMTQLAFLMPLIRPKTTWLWNSLTRMALDGVDDETTPEFLKGAALVGHDIKNDVDVFMRVSGFNPFSGVGLREIGRFKYLPKLVDPTNNPFISASLRLVGANDAFTQQPPPNQNDEINDLQGRTWRLGRDGWKQVSPQWKFTDVMADLIPHMSIYNDLMANNGFQMGSHGPKIFKGPDGKVMNPRHWSWGLARLMGFPLQSVDVDAAQKRDAIRRQYLIKDLVKKAIRMAEPEDRDQTIKLAVDEIKRLQKVK